MPLPDLSTYWPKIPGIYAEMSCDDLLQVYRETGDKKLILYLLLLLDKGRFSKDSKAKTNTNLKRVTVLLYRYVGDGPSFKDAVQDIFVKLSETLKKQQSFKNCGGFVFSIIRNFMINQFNREMRRATVEGVGVKKSGLNDSPQLETVSAEIKMDARKVVDEMEEAVASLSRGWEAVKTRWRLGSYSACAKKMGLTFKGFQGHYQRAHKKLKEKFGENYERYFELAYEPAEEE